MSNRIYPNWEQLNSMHNPLTEGERALIEFLDKKLPKDSAWKEGDHLKDYKGWLIFAQPYLNGTRPDVVIFNPQVGMVIYEVKDWHLNSYEIDVHGNVRVKNQAGSNVILSPIKQVEHYREVLIGQLIPLIGETIDGNKSFFGLIKTGVYFHNSTTKECESLFFPQGKPPYYPMFGHDSLSDDHISEIVPDVRRSNSYYWKKEWNEEIIFWLKPPYHSIEQGTVLKLKGNQNRIAEPQSGHFRVRGTAGSGKTQALAYRAAKLASQGFNVLIVTFNITLWHFIKDMIARAPFGFYWDKIKFDHFHGFCKDILNEYEMKWPTNNNDEGGERFFKVIVPSAVAYAINCNKHHKYQKYDAILIDEGQDFEYEWYDLLNSYFIAQRDELVVVCDKNQNVYERDLLWLDKRQNRRGLEKFGDYIDLTISFRLPPIVADMAIEFADKFGLKSELKLKKAEDNLMLIDYEHIIWKNIDESQLTTEVYSIYGLLKDKGFHPSDTVVLFPNHKLGLDVVGFFENNGIHINHVFGLDYNDRRRHKKSFWMGDGRLKMCTIYSFKGWESQNVVIYIPEDYVFKINFDGEEDLSSADNLDSLVYTAITRTRCNLIVLNNNSRYKTFGSKYSSEWT